MTHNKLNHFPRITCPSCGGDLAESFKIAPEKNNRQEKIVRCISCGSEYDRHTREYYILFQQDYIRQKDNTFLRTGVKGTIDNVNYEIAGRIRYHKEESSETKTWDKWIPKTSEGKHCYIVEDNRSIYLLTEYFPQKGEPQITGKNIIFEDKEIKMNSIYSNRVVFAEGNTDKGRPQIGESITRYDFKDKKNQYTIEKSPDIYKIFKIKKLRHGELISEFKLDEYRQAYLNTLKKRSLYRKKALLYFLFIIISVVLIFHQTTKSSKVHGIMENPAILAHNEPEKIDGAKLYHTEILYGPFKIPHSESLYKTEIYADQLPRGQAINFRGMMISKPRLNKFLDETSGSNTVEQLLNEIDAFHDPLESFSIYDIYIDANQKPKNRKFVIETSGQYYWYFEIYSTERIKKETLKVSMKKEETPGYYFIVALIFLLMAVSKSIRARNYNELAFPFD